MSNVHTFSEYQKNNTRAQHYAVDVPPHSNNQASSTSNLARPAADPSQPYPNQGSSCIQRIFPKFRFKSFTFAITVIDILIFVITVIVDATLSEKNSFGCVLYRFGAKYTPAISVYHHIHRLLIPMILHGGWAHIIFNMLSQSFYGYLLEDFYGLKKFIPLYLLAGFGGNLLSAAAHKFSISVGASSCLFGLFALQFAYIFQNYHALGPRRNFVLGIMVINLVVSLATIADASTIDGMAHLGGFLTGALLAVIYYQRPSDPHFGKKKILAGVLLAIYLIVTFIVTLTFSNLEIPAELMATQCNLVFMT